jgi:hypothetical protein
MHYVVIVALDLPALWLRLGSIAIPLAFGAALMRDTTRGFWDTALAACAVSLLAVTGMSVTVALADGTAVWPANRGELSEFLSYACSIALSFITGMVVWRYCRARAPLGAVGSVLLSLVPRIFSTTARNPRAVQDYVEALQKLLATLTAAATSGLALLTGLKGVIGS